MKIASRMGKGRSRTRDDSLEWSCSPPYLLYICNRGQQTNTKPKIFRNALSLTMREIMRLCDIPTVSFVSLPTHWLSGTRGGRALINTGARPFGIAPRKVVSAGRPGDCQPW